jgi:NADPH-dependent curcumin reductase
VNLYVISTLCEETTGRLKYREDIVDGLEKALASFLGMLQGKNFGKMLVRMAT